MDGANFPIEFHNDIDEVEKSENEFYTLAVGRLSELAEGHNDISGGVVNLRQPVNYMYEVTIVVYMGSDDIAATEKGEQLHATLVGALDAVERQVHERREQQPNY
ncbi:MAG: HPF/RaiA family ribosome-associated protein [Anaerolineae bacterium]|nr:HPF/RaiA family ribosome-associated protein [Anaerolineae bacterium]